MVLRGGAVSYAHSLTRKAPFLRYGWGGGVAGAALAAVASRTAQLCYVAGPVVLLRLHERTWGGFSLDAFLPQTLLALMLQVLTMSIVGRGRGLQCWEKGLIVEGKGASRRHSLLSRFRCLQGACSVVERGS